MSGIDFQVAPIAFNKGLDTRTQPKLVIPGEWRELTNYSMSENTTPTRRAGIAPIVGSANCNGLAEHGEQLLTFTGGAASSVSLSTTPYSANRVSGRLGFVNIEKDEIRRSTGMQDYQDCCSGGGFTLYVWRDKTAVNAPNGLSCTVVDETTGAHVLENASLTSSGTAFTPRCVYKSGVFLIFYIDGTSLYAHNIDGTAPTSVSAATALVTSADLAAQNIDACSFGPDGYVMVVYGWQDTFTSIRTIGVSTIGLSVDFGPIDVFDEANLPSAGVTGMACAGYTGGLTAGIFVTSTGAAPFSGLAGASIDAAWVPRAGGTLLDGSVIGTTTSSVHITATPNDSVGGVPGLQVFWDQVSEWGIDSSAGGTGGLNPLATITVGAFMNILVSTQTVVNSATFGAGSLVRSPQGPFIAGKAFTSNERVFLPVYFFENYNGRGIDSANPRTLNTQNSLFLYEFINNSSVQIVARALYGSYGLASSEGSTPAVSTPCSTPETTSGMFSLAAGEVTLLQLSGVTNVSPTGIVRLKMTPNVTTGPIRDQLGESAFMSGGLLTAYDGTAIAEHGFPLFPEGCGATAAALVGSGLTAGVHQAVAIYEWVDAAGQRHQSAPSLPVTFTSAGGDAFDLYVPTLLLSQKSDIKVIVYMTQAAGLIFNRVMTNGTTYTVTTNDTSVGAVAARLSVPDATIAGNELLYTQPNLGNTTLPNVAPGPCSALANIQNRLFFSKADKPLWFGYSQQYINNVGLQFNPDLESSVSSDSGGITGFAALDEKVIIFCRDKIFVMYGTGPTPSGGFSNYSQPQDIQADVGCIEPRSILSEIPSGVMFQSSKGIYLLGRDLSVKYIGAGVQAYSSGQIYAATMLADRSEARFMTRDEDSFRTLVYSFLTDTWSTHACAPQLTYFVSDAVWWRAMPQDGVADQGAYVLASTTWGLNFEDDTAIADTPGNQQAYPIETIAKTSWLALAKLEGFQRVRRLYLTATAEPGSSLANTLGVNISFDDQENGPNGYSLLCQPILVGGTVDVRHKLHVQKCKSVMFEIINTQGQPDSDPMTGIQALALEVGIKRGTNKLSASQTAE